MLSKCSKKPHHKFMWHFTYDKWKHFYNTYINMISLLIQETFMQKHFFLSSTLCATPMLYPQNHPMIQ